jgi:hypothetical protein
VILMKHRSLLPHLLGRLWMPLVLTVFATLIASRHARAGLIVSVESVTANAGSTGNALDVTLTNTGPSAVTISGFSFEVSVGTSNVTFTEANISTTVPYIFQGESLFGPVISTGIGKSLPASDVFAISGSGATVGAGTEVGLGHVLFDVSALAPSGPVVVSLVPFPTTTLADPSGNNIIIDSLNNGTITVISGTVIPEPSTIVLAITGIPAVAWFVRLRRRRSGKPGTEFH